MLSANAVIKEENFLCTTQRPPQLKLKLKKTVHFATRNFHAIQMEMVRPTNEFAVICHGDLWWSNVLFKYDPDTGSPVEVKFIDFQSSRVASLGKGAGSQSKGISKNIKSENQTFCKIRDSCIWIILRVFDIFNQFSCF